MGFSPVIEHLDRLDELDAERRQAVFDARRDNVEHLPRHHPSFSISRSVCVSIFLLMPGRLRCKNAGAAGSTVQRMQGVQHHARPLDAEEFQHPAGCAVFFVGRYIVFHGHLPVAMALNGAF